MASSPLKVQAPITIRPATRRDVSAMLDIDADSFRGGELDRAFRSVLGDNMILRYGHGITCKRRLCEPALRDVVAVDGATGQVVGFAQWDAEGDSNPVRLRWEAESRPWWSSLEYLLATAEFKYWRYVGGAASGLDWRVIGQYREGRAKAEDVVPKDHLHLQLVCVAPEHQGRGIGKALVEWGTRIADADGVACSLESSVAGKPVYSKLGFETVRTLWVAQGIEGREYEMPIMVRPAAVEGRP